MEPTEPLSKDESEAPPSLHGELILRTGRQTGTRRALQPPMSLLGRGAGCDIRLNVETVQPLHCALFIERGQLWARDLNTPEGTFVNQQRITTSLLRNGDTLQIGPFEFEVVLPLIAETTPPSAEMEALRIQAAAVVAQQSVLFEEETDLASRRVALDKQEEQLSAHLEERRRQLVELQEQIRQERSELQSEQAAVQELKQQARAEKKALQQELRQELEAAKKERARLVALRKRLRQRWKRHWTAYEKALTARADELHGIGLRLQRDRAAYDETRRRLNGELELTRREFQQEQIDFAAVQDRWSDYLQRERANLTDNWNLLEERKTALSEGERTLAAKQLQVEQLHARLGRESAGLEARIENLRARLSELIPAAGWWSVGGLTQTTAAQSIDVSAGNGLVPEVQSLEQLADSLSDQRLHLIDQWETFLRLQENWLQSHQALLPELEQTAEQLNEREQQLSERERQLDTQWVQLQQQQQTQANWHAQLQGWQSRLVVAESERQGERDRLLSRIEHREALVERRMNILDRLRQRWARRRQSEQARVEEQWQRCQELQKQYLSLWEECEKRRGELHDSQRSLAERTLALQQLQLEVIGRSGDSAAAEKRLERFRKQWTAMQSQAEKAWIDHRSTLKAEIARLQGAAQRISQQAGSLNEREADLARQQTNWEQEQAAIESTVTQQEEELERLRQAQALSERQLADLREEVERLVRLMLDEPVQTSKAA